MRDLSRTLKLGLAALCAAWSSALAAAPAVVVLPFENFSATETAPREVESRLVAALVARGWTIAPADGVNALLEERRIRYLDSLDADTRGVLLQGMNAAAYVSGTVYTFEGGRNPVVAFSARMVRADGTVAWADVVGVASTDTERLLGFGRASTVEAVADVAVRRLSRDLPSSAEDSHISRGPSRPMFRSGPSTYRSPELDPTRPHLVCVLPFENDSLTPEASRIVADIIALRFAAVEGFEVVDPAKLRAAAVKAGVPSFRAATNDTLARLAPQLGTSLFLRGTVYDFTDSSGAATDPFVQLEMSVVDVTENRVVWSAQHERHGTDYTGLLLLGAASNGVLLTDRVITEVVDAQSHAAASGTPSTAAERPARKRLASRHSELRSPIQKEDQ